MNRLATETSPYLLQHAHNPVNWYPWGEEALEAAKAANRPILVSIGYAACHWCHVMERESFEDPAIAAVMNELFVCIKVDREERPDIDHIYMDALTTMTGSGGWPLNVFLTPDGKPFYGGTYFPPVTYQQRPSWMDVLQGVSKAWMERKDELLNQADNLTAHLIQSNRLGEEKKSMPDFHADQLNQIAVALLKNADTEKGGFGRAPKFPQTFSIIWLLRYSSRFLLPTYRFKTLRFQEGQEPGALLQPHWKTGAVDFNAPEAFSQALLSLNKMIEGGIYDQIGGGLARYATDNDWLIPHFEKMLYDQALFISALAEAYQLTGKEEYETAIQETIAFIERELMSPDGSFYAALDADSEGEEGKFYVWEKGEVEELLGSDAALACDWLGITQEGNWEGINILTKSRKLLELLELGYCSGDVELLKERLGNIREQLFVKRSDRIRPGLDDKQLVGWNALLNTALSKAFSATGEERYKELALRNMDWMLKVFLLPEGKLSHTYKKGEARFPGFLDDYAYLVQALSYLHEISGKPDYLEIARSLVETVEREFGSPDSTLFYYTNQQQQDVIVRKREVYDGAQPSGNGIMAFNFRYLGIVLDKPEWRDRAANMVSSMTEMVVRYPGSFGAWGLELIGWVDGYAEIAVIGPQSELLGKEILANFIPYKVLQSATHESDTYPLLRQKSSLSTTLIHLCQQYTCLRPVGSVKELLGHF